MVSGMSITTSTWAIAEHCAKEYKIGRAEQDAFAVESYKRAQAAVARGAFVSEIVPVEVASSGAKGAPSTMIAVDEEPAKVNFEKLPTLKPAFIKDGGTVTAANSSKLNDGAAALVLMSREEADRLGVKPMARIVSYGDAETAPIDFTIAPALAIPLALKRAGLTVKDIDSWEINEAFAVVALVNERLLGLDPAKVNRDGGAVALGHPIGASGGRLLVHLVHQLKAMNGRYGCAAICNGGGGASALVLERL